MLIAVSGLLMTVTVFFGISALTVLSVIAVPAIACLGGYSVWLAVNGMGGLDALKAVVPAQPLDFNVALGIAAGHWLPGIVPVNAVLGGALSYLILNPILNRKTTAAMTHVEVNSVE